MERLQRTRLVGLALLLFLALPGFAHAQPGGDYDLTWSTIDAGGTSLSAGGGYSLAGTAGQPDASLAQSGGVYTLAGGFWAATAHQVPAPQYHHIYLPIIMRND